MPTFTIDNDNNITAHGTPEEAAAATATPFDSFSSQKELTELIATWPAERLVAIWNAPILLNELRQPHPAFESLEVNADGVGCLFVVLVREEGSDGRLLFPPIFRSMSLHRGAPGGHLGDICARSA